MTWLALAVMVPAGMLAVKFGITEPPKRHRMASAENQARYIWGSAGASTVPSRTPGGAAYSTVGGGLPGGGVGAGPGTGAVAGGACATVSVTSSDGRLITAPEASTYCT